VEDILSSKLQDFLEVGERTKKERRLSYNPLTPPRIYQSPIILIQAELLGSRTGFLAGLYKAR
jgi:hypothetical protein